MANYNMITVKLRQFREMVRKQLEAKLYTPIFALGKPGVGKTETLSALAKELGIGYCEFRVASMTLVDVLGMPHEIEQEKGGMVTLWSPNGLLPNEERDGAVGILALDEITAAKPEMRTTLLQLLDSRRQVASYKFPEHWVCIAIGNDDESGADYQGIESPFIGRCGLKMLLDPDFDDWKPWALQHDINTTILAFIESDKSKLNTFDPSADVEVYASQRDWANFSKFLNHLEACNGGAPLDEMTVSLFAKASVGEKVGPEFAMYYRYNTQIVSAEALLNGTAEVNFAGLNNAKFYLLQKHVNQIIIDDLKGTYDANLCYRFDEKIKLSEEVKLRLTNFIKFIVELPSSEWRAVTITDLTHTISASVGIFYDVDHNMTGVFNDRALRDKFKKAFDDISLYMSQQEDALTLAKSQKK